MLPPGWKSVNHAKMPLGKAAARRDERTLALSSYASKLNPAPPTCSLFAKLENIGMMLNDNLGDCTCAAVGHLVQTWTSLTKTQVIIPDSEIEALYEAVSGYVPGNPSTDQGAVEMDVLNYWRKNPIDGHALDAFVYINSKKMQELFDSVYYFGGAYIGVQLPLSAQTQSIWDAASGSQGAIGSWGGHAIPIVGYDQKYIYCITWGQIKAMTYAFYAKYCDEAYALLSSDWCSPSGKTPEGFDMPALQADLNLIASA